MSTHVGSGLICSLISESEHEVASIISASFLQLNNAEMYEFETLSG